MALGFMIELSPGGLSAACAGCALEAGKDRLPRVSGTPAPHAGDVPLILVEVYRHVAGLLIKPTAYEGGEQGRIGRRHGEVIGAGHARGVEHDLRVRGERHDEADQYEGSASPYHVISLFNDHPDRADPCKLQRHPSAKR